LCTSTLLRKHGPKERAFWWFKEEGIVSLQRREKEIESEERKNTNNHITLMQIFQQPLQQI